ncbi:unnamed protein product [Colias eurytheme]|nr:unnamed protein product [Colias eurytheme]
MSPRKGISKNTLRVLPTKAKEKIPATITLQAISVPRDDNDVLLRITTRDVSIVTAGQDGHLQAPDQVLLMQGAPLHATERRPNIQI